MRLKFGRSTTSSPNHADSVMAAPSIDRRHLLTNVALGLGTTAICGTGAIAAPSQLSIRIQKLDWAGLRIEAAETVAYIDAVAPDDSKRARSVPAASTRKNRIGLITHEHGDHYDAAYLASLIGPDGTLVCCQETARSIPKAAFRVKEAKLWEPIFLPRFGSDMVAVAVPASDGFGVPQVSWIIKVGDKRIIHCGDTLWHGHFANIAALFGPFDYVFLPINGARQNIGRFVDTGVAMVLMPEQAVAAAQVLKARTLVPMHYGSPDPPTYLETDRPIERLMVEAKRRGVEVKILDIGEWLTIA